MLRVLLIRFKDRRMSVDDGSRRGRSSTSIDDAHVTKVNDVVRIDVSTVREIEEDFNISVGSYHEILIEKI